VVVGQVSPLAFQAREWWSVAKKPPHLKHKREGWWLAGMPLQLIFQVREGD